MTLWFLRFDQDMTLVRRTDVAATSLSDSEKMLVVKVFKFLRFAQENIETIYK